MDSDQTQRSRTIFSNLEIADNTRKGSKRFQPLCWLIIGFFVLCGLSISTLVVLIVQGNRKTEIFQTIDPNRNESTNSCQSPGCILAAAHQLRSIDVSAYEDRCTNFFRFACGKWLQNHPILSHNVERTVFTDILDQRDFNIQQFLDAPILRNDPNSWEYKVKNFYSECRDDYARLSDTGKTLISLIEDENLINGWFLLDNSASTSSQDFLLKNQTVAEQIATIHGDFGASIFFGLRTRFVENDPDSKRLEFFPDGLTMNTNDYSGTDDISRTRRSAFRNFLKSVLEILASDGGVQDENLEDRIETVAEDVFYLETAIAKAMTKSPGGNNGSPLSTTLAEMSDEYQFDFVELMSHELSDPSVVSRSTVVYIVNTVYFQEIFQILSEKNNLTLNRIIHNYVRWRFVRKYIEDLSYNYVDTYRRYLQNYFGFPLHSTNEEFCEREVLQKFPLAIYRLYTRNSNNVENNSKTLDSMIKILNENFQNYVDEKADWIPDNETKTFAKNKIKALTSSIGYASIAMDDDLLDEFYNEFTVGTLSHFQNAYSYRQFELWKLTNSLINPNILDHWDSFEERPNRLFEYIARFNRLFVVASALREPLISSEWPWSVNVGSLGVLLAERIFASIDNPEGRTYSSNGTRIPDWWSTQTASTYNQTRKCLTDYYVRDVQSLTYHFNNAEIVIRIAGEPFSGTTFRQIGALRVAYQTLKTNELSTFQMPGTNFTREQTFFLSYAQTQCYQREDLSQILRTTSGVYDEQTALNAAFLNMPEFQEAFQCSPRPNSCFK